MAQAKKQIKEDSASSVETYTDEQRLAAGLPVAYYISELPQKALDALKKAEMHPRHNHLNDLLDD